MTVSPVLTRIEHIKFYITLFSSGLKLTPKEVEIVETILIIRSELVDKKVPEEFIDEMIFSKYLPEIRTKCNLSAQNYYFYKNCLVDKKVFRELDGKIYINDFIIPKEELIFKFQING